MVSIFLKSEVSSETEERYASESQKKDGFSCGPSQLNCVLIFFQSILHTCCPVLRYRLQVQVQAEECEYLQRTHVNVVLYERLEGREDGELVVEGIAAEIVHLQEEALRLLSRSTAQRERERRGEADGPFCARSRRGCAALRSSRTPSISLRCATDCC